LFIGGSFGGSSSGCQAQTEFAFDVGNDRAKKGRLFYFVQRASGKMAATSSFWGVE